MVTYSDSDFWLLCPPLSSAGTRRFPREMRSAICRRKNAPRRYWRKTVGRGYTDTLRSRGPRRYAQASLENRMRPRLCATLESWAEHVPANGMFGAAEAQLRQDGSVRSSRRRSAGQASLPPIPPTPASQFVGTTYGTVTAVDRARSKAISASPGRVSARLPFSTVTTGARHFSALSLLRIGNQE